MAKFKVGDRVACYWTEDFRHVHRDFCKVIEISSGGVLRVLLVDGTTSYYYHKQCRLLKKKERRRVWVLFGDDGLVIDSRIVDPGYVLPVGPWVEFAEVKK